MSTGIAPFDNFVRLVLNVLLAILVVMMAARMVKMLHRHEYAQLVATLLLFIVAFWFINGSDSVVNIFKALTGSMSGKIGGGGGGMGM